jgi:hypothetical protein
VTSASLSRSKYAQPVAASTVTVPSTGGGGAMTSSDEHAARKEKASASGSARRVRAGEVRGTSMSTEAAQVPLRMILN